MNYLTYLTKFMNITQNYKQHTNYSDFPIDDAGKDAGRDYCYCPCDEMIIKRIYGIGSSGTNTIWLQSTTEVITPTFTDYVTIMIEHPNDDTLSQLKEGQIFKRGETMFLEGNDGNATGNHFHISVSKGKYVASGWIQNSYGLWGITGNPQKPEDCFYLDRSFTTVVNRNGLKFIELPNNLPEYVQRDVTKEQVEVIVDGLRVRTTPYINDNNIIGFIQKGIYNVINITINDGYMWYEVEDEKWIADNGNYLKVYHTESDDDLVLEPDNSDEVELQDEPDESDIDIKENIIIIILKRIIAFIKKLF